MANALPLVSGFLVVLGGPYLVYGCFPENATFETGFVSGGGNNVWSFNGVAYMRGW
ncbi:MAG: hypothetical protein IH920_05220 [Chloroflexi bacterium]|nr:hypothetical protein [Chloroflexota bacterium]